MPFVTLSERARVVPAGLGTAAAVCLWAMSLWFAAVPAAAEPAAPIRAGASKVADVAGRYAILRAGGKDTGCMLTLDDKTRGPHGSFKAILAPGCNDQGMLIFDPVGWEIAGGRLALVARKGHQAHLDKEPDGTWTKDPKEGAPLLLRKM